MTSWSTCIRGTATVRRCSANQPNSRPYAPIDSTPSALTASVLVTGAIPSHANEFFHRVGATGIANGLGSKEEYFCLAPIPSNYVARHSNSSSRHSSSSSCGGEVGCSSNRHRRRSGWTFLGGRMASAEGGSVPSGVGHGKGCPLSSRLRGLRERRELPQRGPGQNPGGKRILACFEGHRTLIFVPI